MESFPIPVFTLGIPEIIQTALAGFPVKMIDLVKYIDLSDPTELSENVEELWTSSTVTWPRLLKSSEVWTIDPIPSSTKLILATLDLIQAAKATPPHYSVYRRGERDAKTDARVAVAQLVEPRRSDPTTIIGLTILAQDSLRVPLAFSEHADAYDISNEQMLLTPKFSHTDLHIDTADGLSIPIGNCAKLFLCFPPTPHNLALMAKADAQKCKLIRIGKKLEGGTVFHTTSSHAIYLPAGVIHTVFTTHGGFLASMDFNTPRSSFALAALVTSLVDKFAPSSFRDELFDRLLKSIELGLSDNREILAISAWISALPRLLEHGKQNLLFKNEMGRVWGEFFLNPHHKAVGCPCGKQGRESTKTHLNRCHMEVKRVVELVESGRDTRSSRKRKERGNEEVFEQDEIEGQADASVGRESEGSAKRVKRE